MEVVVDTNALIYSAKKKMDLFGALNEKEYIAVILSCVVDELKSLCSDAPSGSDKTAAKLSLQLITHARVKLVKVGAGNADDLILEYALAHKTAIITNDKPLKQRAKAHKLVTFSVSKGGQLR